MSYLSPRNTTPDELPTIPMSIQVALLNADRETHAEISFWLRELGYSKLQFVQFTYASEEAGANHLRELGL